MMQALLDWIAPFAGMTGLLFFFAMFTGIALWVYRPGAKQQIESHKYIPLSEEAHELR